MAQHLMFMMMMMMMMVNTTEMHRREIKFLAVVCLGITAT
jgi:hypothetical protein